MRSKIFAEIHDSLLLYFHPEEKDILIEKILYYGTKLIPKMYSWINVPLKIEIEATEIDQAWYYKKEIAVPAIYR